MNRSFWFGLVAGITIGALLMAAGCATTQCDDGYSAQRCEANDSGYKR